MFNSSNPFPSSCHGFHPPSGFFSGQEKDGGCYNQHPFVAQDCSFNHAPLPPPPPIKESHLENHDKNNHNYSNGHDHNHLNPSDSVISPPRKRVAASKKDRRSKIFTAQGPRDRRVRLSIDISKKFFGLQDLLGFDKASKTLDWLFTKSKIPIEELVKDKDQSSSSTVTDQSEVVFPEIVEERSDVQDKGVKKKPGTKSVEGKGKKVTPKNNSASPMNQSRAEARARARERTKEKMSIKKLDGECCSSNFALQSSFWSGIDSQSDYSGKIGESTMEENISMFYSYEHNIVSNNSRSKSNCSFPIHGAAHEQEEDRATN